MGEQQAVRIQRIPRGVSAGTGYCQNEGCGVVLEGNGLVCPRCYARGLTRLSMLRGYRSYMIKSHILENQLAYKRRHEDLRPHHSDNARSGKWRRDGSL